MNPDPLYPRRNPAARKLPWWLLLLVTLIAVFVFQQWHAGFQARPLTYRIGTVDERFGMSREAFSNTVGQAVSLWQQAVPRELFRETPDGALEINLVYDYRQESSDRLKTLSLKIDDTKGSYENLKAHLETLKGEADQKGASLAQGFAAYNARVGAFNAQSEAARRTPVAESSYRRLESERKELAEAKTALMHRQEDLKETAKTLNSLVVVINGFAANHNLDLVDYHQTGDRLGPEFSEGEYIQEGGRRTITIYHFPSQDGLVRVLAHELGHAQGLSHLENPQAVMHRLMRTDSLDLSLEDIQAMKAKTGSR
jgi:hypothetical protein